MKYEISKFLNEVINKINYYVYRLIDPRNGETFYIGKGKGNRVFNHINCVLTEDNIDEKSGKIQTIREIHGSGLKVIHVIHRHNLTDDESKLVESVLIDSYPGAKNIVKGKESNDFGSMNALEIINKYSIEEIDIEHNLLMITINKSILERNSIYDATRFAWTLSENKMKKVEYVLGIKHGSVVGVFKPIKWMKATKDNFPEFGIDRNKRWGFEGIDADKVIMDKYLNKKCQKGLKRKVLQIL